MSYSINLGQWNSIFAVPSSVVDRYIKLASEAQLKTLLYILRHAGETVDEERLCGALNITAEEAANALEFWIGRELLVRSNDELRPADTKSEIPVAVNNANSQNNISDIEQEKPKKQKTSVSRAQRPDPMFVSRLLKENEYLAALLDEAQRILNKPLSPGDTATIVMLYDTFGLPCEVIAMLLAYLSSIGSANMRALERYGIRWSDEGVTTTDAAAHEIERMISSKEAWGRVSQLIGVKNVGNPTASQTEHADRWINEWGFSDEMILEAYERCVNTKGEYSIRYMNGILKRWYEKRIFSLETLRKEEDAKKSKPKTPSKSKSGKGSMFTMEGASFDVDKYENDSLFDD